MDQVSAWEVLAFWRGPVSANSNLGGVADFLKTSAASQLEYIRNLLKDGITDLDPYVRILSARQLLYIAEG